MSLREIFDDLEEQVTELQHLIDAIDETRFGELEKHFDKMGRVVASAMKRLNDFDNQCEWDHM